MSYTVQSTNTATADLVVCFFVHLLYEHLFTCIHTVYLVYSVLTARRVKNY